MALTLHKYSRPLDASLTSLNSFLGRKANIPKQSRSYDDLSKLNRQRDFLSRKPSQCEAPRSPLQTISFASRSHRSFNEIEFRIPSFDNAYLGCDTSRADGQRFCSSLSLVHLDADKESYLANSKRLQKLFSFYHSTDSFECLPIPSFHGSDVFFDCEPGADVDSQLVSPSNDFNASQRASSLECPSSFCGTDESFHCRGLSSSQLTPKFSALSVPPPSLNQCPGPINQAPEPSFEQLDKPTNVRDLIDSPGMVMMSHHEDSIRNCSKDPPHSDFHRSLESLEGSSLPSIEEETLTASKSSILGPEELQSKPHGLSKCPYFRRVISKTKKIYVKLVLNLSSHSTSSLK